MELYCNLTLATVLDCVE